MKKTIKLFGLLFCALMMSVSFASCSDDDDDKNDKVSDTSIVGTWEWSDRYDYESITFRANGTFRSVYYELSDPSDKYTEEGRYILSGDLSKGAMLRMIWEEDDDDEVYMAYLSGNTLRLVYDDGDEYETIVLTKK